ncbi:MAG: YbaB/EbfC family nucleoid-associated protein [Desulfobulbaceae bacterium]|nr:YbaB/EbfC family nucleoid-associated protein [Desulfobulbaceae bacterium]
MNMGDLLKQAQQFQQKLTEIQQELGNKTVTGTAGGGMVTATFNGRSELTGITIEKEVVNPEDVQLLQDLVASAVNDGLIKSKELGKTEMSKLTGGMNIPGLI